ncbi:hypothetical protein OIU76_002931 [Salix suchowensis]|nr:hypothetical protein OIU76_002931 [Salix suchowensis]
MYYYWYLTNDGIEFLRTYLNLPSEIVPEDKPAGGRPFGAPTCGPPRFEGDRDGYRGGLEGVKVARREELQQITSLHLEDGQALVVEEEVMVQHNLVLLALLEGAAIPSILLCSYLTSDAGLRTFCALVLLLAI